MTPSAFERFSAGVQRADKQRAEHLAIDLLEYFFDLDTRVAGYELLRQMQQSHAKLFAHVADGDDLVAIAADALVDSQPPPTNVDELADTVTLALATQPRRLLAVPLTNLELAESFYPIDSDTALIGAINSTGPAFSAEYHRRQAQIHDHFGAPAAVALRDGPMKIGDEDERARLGAALLLAGRGRPGALRFRGQAITRYALACWTALRSPTEQDHGFVVWPGVADFVPAPTTDWMQTIKTIDPPGRDHTGGGFVYAAYEAPTDHKLLTLPFRAMTAASDGSVSASALLSCAWALYLASQTPSPLQWADRAAHAVAARSALVAGRPGERGDEHKRWNALAESLDLDKALADYGYEAGAALANDPLVMSARHIATHSNESFALNTGGKLKARRGVSVPKAQLVPTIGRSALRFALDAVAEATSALLKSSDTDGFDDETYYERLDGN